MLMNIDVEAIEEYTINPKKGRELLQPISLTSLLLHHDMCVAEHPPHLTACTMMTCLVVMSEFPRQIWLIIKYPCIIIKIEP